ncbi:MAG: PilZ domain-containing protein [Sphingomonas sp.]|uniref:PilZ domain-containing protein n=1 Tax=Sphingomonas sp. TaxID=28214 RepID=UPI001AD25D16|nr:PilZ domain-containing protein [Sphingomonas sp.]MBN8808541.1 PilZ domain-containing protein [Sphingomonas sp.]
MATRFSQYRQVEPASLERRDEPRLKLSVTRASVRRHGKAPVEALLHDLSAYGCRIASEIAAEAGERLWLRFDGRMPIAATVVWCEGGMVGCRFDEPIDRAMMRALTLRLV